MCTKYQMSEPSGFRQEDIPYISLYVKHVGANAGPFLAPGL